MKQVMRSLHPAARKRRGYRVGSLLVVLASNLVLTACVAPRMTPEPARLAQFRRVVVLAVDPPPLLVTIAAARSVGADIMRAAIPLTTAPVRSVQAGAPALVLLGGIVMLIEAVATGTFTVEPVQLSEVMTRESTWSPTRELADEAAAQLRAASSFSVTTSMKTRELPVKSLEVTWHMENWYRPIRAWYGDETAGVDYRNEAGPDSVVLEVGILNYEWHTRILGLQVMMRLIDVETGRVVGRTRQWATPTVGLPAELLGGDNRRLKSLVVETARPLAATSLQELRLVTR